MTRTGILLTGGDGKTASRIAAQLGRRGVQARRTSRTERRTGEGHAVRFDWSDPTTHGAALDGAGTVYLVAPSDVADPLDTMAPFLRRALQGGVRRYVLLSASALPGSRGKGWARPSCQAGCHLPPDFTNLITPVEQIG